MDDPAGFVAKLGLYLTLMPLFGLPAFAWIERWRGRQARLGMTAMLLLTLAALLLSLLQFAALAASMSGTPLRLIDRAMFDALAAAGPLYLAWQIRIAALLAIAASTLLAKRWPVPAVVFQAVAATAALGSLAWFGHGAMDEGAAGWLHLGADLLHLLAAGLWTGALVTLVTAVWRQGVAANQARLAQTERALAGFAATGTLVVAVLVVTGLANAWFLIGPSNLVALPFDPYGRLLIAKLLLFGAMLVLAALNRFRLTPRLASALTRIADRPDPIAHLRASLAVETVTLAAILVLVAWLGMLAPTGSG